MEPQDKPTNEQIKDAPEYFNPAQERNLEMTMVENKKLHRDSMVFPFRWFVSLNELPDKEFRQMFMAIGGYAENKTFPSFSGALAALWKEYQQRIDADSQKYIDICQRNRENGLKGGRPLTKPKEPSRIFRNPDESKKADTDPDADIKERTLKSSKETEEPFSLTSEISKHIPYTEWTPEQFREEIAKYPEYANIADEFYTHWTESTIKGKMIFQVQPKWDTRKRLQTWQRNNERWNKSSQKYIADVEPTYKMDDGKDDFARGGN